ncbi:MAG: hypothetical protein AAF356_09805 [Planctomycetota bacterium]
MAVSAIAVAVLSAVVFPPAGIASVVLGIKVWRGARQTPPTERGQVLAVLAITLGILIATVMSPVWLKKALEKPRIETPAEASP